MAIGPIAQEAVVDGLADWVDLSHVAGIAKRNAQGSTDGEVMELTIAAVKELVNEGLMTPGTIRRGGYESWQISVADLEARIRQEWEPPNRMIELGESALWLQNTVKGRELGHQLQPLFDEDDED